MTHHFLLEIGLEEMPARLVTASSQQLKEKTAAFLADSRLSYESIEIFSTPRRLALRVNNLATKQEDISEVAKGPAKKIAMDDEGNWSKAAQGFARGQGMNVADIFFEEIKGVEYVHINKFIPGKTAAEILPEMLNVVTGLNFPVSMHWGSNDFKYIRPIHWLVALLDGNVIPMQLLDVTSDRISRGHRFLGAEAVINDALDYEAKLAEQFVIVDSDKRQKMIVDQIAVLASQKNWLIDLDEGLLDEVNNLVEYPTAFAGNFSEKYLEIPSEVLITSMKEHQRYFDVKDQKGSLLPHFIAVRNGNDTFIEQVASGNEKVLTARLEDAEFFYQDDQKLLIADCVEKLKNVTFHEKIGSIYEKMLRVQAIAQLLGKQVGLTPLELADLARASEIYKFDLMTNMVGEFPELQGIMGEKYALMQGENAQVAQAIREHYLPISSEGELPSSAVGAVLAVADKVDSLVSFFNVGMMPTGSNDPYALRRQTYGIIRIVAHMGWDFPLINIQDDIVEIINKNPKHFGIELVETKHEVTGFIKGRMKQFLMARGIRHDIIEAVTSHEQNDLAKMVEASNVLKKHHSETSFKPAVEALTRVLNLAKKASDNTQEEPTINPSLFENEAERALYAAVENVESQRGKRSLAENYAALTNLYPLIEAYFEETMVMAENEGIRENRLNQLKKLALQVRDVASLDLLVVKQGQDK